MENRMNSCNCLSLYEKFMHKSKPYRAYACIHLALLLSFVSYRLLNPLHESYGLWIAALACELCFSFYWILHLNIKWLPIEYITHPERLASRYSGESASNLPAVDIIITTTSPFKEPAIMTANTVLSVLAMDYPVEKMACYVSDDGASPITFYSLVETLSFAKKWVPFCRKYIIDTRAPSMYFSKETKPSDSNFLREWQEMKDEYESLEEKITKTMETRQIPLDFVSSNDIDGFVYRSSDISNHVSIVQVIHENKRCGRNEDGVLPHLIYVAREKRPKVDHHYKAGAMNVMARVSGVMTNAPFILNLDCDMHTSNSKAIQQAMCFFLDCPFERECGFVQFPQLFYGGLKDDPFGNQHNVFMKTTAKGMNGIQGPLYFGTCCFHRRKGLYGVPPAINIRDVRQGKDSEYHHYSSSPETLTSAFGDSSVLVASAQAIIRDTPCKNCSPPSLAIEESLKVANCSYEAKTAWGKEVGWVYGAQAEDVMTGLKIHSLGWHSIYYTPEHAAFLGCQPGNAPDTLVQQKRWGTGLLEVFISKSCPLLGMNRHILPRQRLLYAYFNLWTIWSVPTICYSILPAFSLLSGKSFLPKMEETAFSIAVALFLSVYGYKFLEWVLNGSSVREWWNNQRMWLIVCISSWLFALFDVAMKVMGLSETVFVVTPKGSGDEEQGNEGDFKFNSSPVFIPPVTVLIINLVAIFQSTVSFVMGSMHDIKGKPFAEYLCSVWVLINLWPLMKGLVRKGKRGIPWSVVFRSCALALFLWSAWFSLN